MKDRHAIEQIRWPLDRETARLLGAHIGLERADLMLSPDTFVAGMNRNESWLAAVERGEIALTKAMVEDIGVAFDKAGRLVDLEQTAGSIQSYPFGEEALRLRAATGPAKAATEEPGATEGFGMDAIAGIDRLLVVAPAVIIVAFGTLVARMLAWSLEPTDPAGPDAATRTLVSLLDAVLLPAAVVATLAIAFGLLLGDRLLGSAARRLRPALTSVDLGVVKKLCMADGIDYPGDVDWKFAFLRPHLIEQHRKAVGAAALRTAFSERAVPALVACVVLAMIGAVVALADNGLGDNDAGPILLVALGLGLVLSAHRESKRSSGECAAEVSRGLGWKLDRAKEQGLRQGPSVK